MNHLELGELESRSAAGTSADNVWSRWLDKVGQGVGGNYDGDGEENGYSIDEAYDFFLAGKTAAHYIATVKARPNFKPRND